MVVVAQAVRAPDCGSGGRGFESPQPPIPNKPPTRTFYVYILYCTQSAKSYVGHTGHLLIRMRQHRGGECPSTKSMRDVILVHWESFPTRSEAMKRERFLKSGIGFEERKQIIYEFVSIGL